MVKFTDLLNALPTPGVPGPEDITGGADKGAGWIESFMSNPEAVKIVAALLLAGIGITLWKYTWVKIIVAVGVGIIIASFIL